MELLDVGVPLFPFSFVSFVFPVVSRICWFCFNLHCYGDTSLALVSFWNCLCLVWSVLSFFGFYPMVFGFPFGLVFAFACIRWL